jgi:hypothetical protein
MWRLIETTLSATEARVIALHYAHEVPLRAITLRLGLSNPSGAKAYTVNARWKLCGVLHNHPARCLGIPMQAVPLRARFYPMGFPVDFVTDSLDTAVAPPQLQFRPSLLRK